MKDSKREEGTWPRCYANRLKRMSQLGKGGVVNNTSLLFYLFMFVVAACRIFSRSS